MAYNANQYNYATPLSSVAGLINENNSVDDIKYFTLSDNLLDGSYRLISGDVGLWGATASSADGSLSEPYILTVTDTATINAFRLVGSQYCYPVAFTVKLYNGSTLLYTITESSNDSVEYVYALPRTLSITSYELTVTKVSAAGQAVRLHNIYYPAYVKRADSVKVKYVEASTVSFGLYFNRADTLLVHNEQSKVAGSGVATVVHVQDTVSLKETSKSTGTMTISVDDTVRAKISEKHYVRNVIDITNDLLKSKQSASTHILNTIDKTPDVLKHKVVEDISHVTNIFDVIHDRLRLNNILEPTLTNVHTRMKDLTRRIYGKVYITYTDPMLEIETSVESSMAAYNSSNVQAIDGMYHTEDLLFTLYNNDLSGDYLLMTPQSQVGWVSKEVSNDSCEFEEAPYLKINFSERPVTPLKIYFDGLHGSIAKDFTVEFVHTDGTSTIKTFVDNEADTVVANEDIIINVVSVIIRVTKTVHPNFPVAILEVPVLSTILYEGYKDHSD